MKSLFDPVSLIEIKNRLNLIDQNSSPKWGKMNAGQMLAHCQGPLRLALSELTLKRPNVVVRSVARIFRYKLYDDKKWGHGIPTAKEFLVKNERNLDKEKNALENLIEDFHKKGAEHEWPIHPIFGQFTSEQWGKMQYKHLDHHLRQFGV
ncbi:DUF1569 domain-containing protein [Zhouia amylolytica]|uniref:DUF1569 domain-containing protein n=1 Tax=Zhouia amylolytica AD3 TaxID=1286632 RepID=W2URS0_9FLAO|nr:DUF1569 domain-containing protein [Zhouia amylolytica]ETN96713.1 hypothetical protein P278_01390 [Zhouia amylolytica AD3]